MNEIIFKLIEKNNVNEAEFGKELCNHLPMALFALNALGANEYELVEFNNAYLNRILKELFPIKKTDKNILPQQDLGNRALEYAWRQYFENEIQENGLEYAMSRAMKFLAGGVTASAFHGLIRTAYGLEFNHLPEIIAGLAYWASTYLPLADIDNSKRVTGDLKGFLLSLQKEVAFKTEVPGFNIFRRMEKVGRIPQFKIPVLDIPSQTYITEGSDLSAQIFAEFLDFTSLHMMTSYYALRILAKHLNEKNISRLCTYHWQAICAAYIVLGMPEINRDKTRHVQCSLSWDDIKKEAMQSKDDHVIKVTYSCYEEEKYYNRNFYKNVAAKYIEKTA